MLTLAEAEWRVYSMREFSVLSLRFPYKYLIISKLNVKQQQKQQQQDEIFPPLTNSFLKSPKYYRSLLGARPLSSLQSHH